MQFAVKVGQREVIASGVLVLGAGERDASFNLDGMEFLVRLEPRDGALAVEFIRRDIKHLMIRISGYFPEFSAAWKLGAIAEAGERKIDLDLMVYSQSAEPDAVRQMSFSFTAAPAPMAQARSPAFAVASPPP